MLLFVMIIIVLLFVIYCSNLYVRKLPGKNIHYQTICQNLQTGDIILFSCYNKQSIINKTIYEIRSYATGCVYAHVGMIVRSKRNQLYVLECCSADQIGNEYAYHLNAKSKEGGIRIIPLHIILHLYTHQYGGTYAIRHIQKPIANHVLWQALQAYRSILFQPLGVVSGVAVIDLYFSRKRAREYVAQMDPQRMFCAEFLHRILHDCQVLRKYPSKLFWPQYYTNHKLNSMALIPYSDLITFHYTS